MGLLNSRTLLRRLAVAGQLTNILLYVVLLVGYSLVIRRFTSQEIGAGLIAVILTSAVMSTCMPVIMRRLNGAFFRALDQAGEAAPADLDLKLIRDFLVLIPFRAGTASTVAWIVVIPLIIFLALMAAGKRTASWLELEMIALAISPVTVASTVLAAHRATAPFIREYFPSGNLESYGSALALTERSRLILFFAIFGPYSLVLLLLLALRVLEKSNSVDEAVARLVPVEAYAVTALVVISVALLYQGKKPQLQAGDQDKWEKTLSSSEPGSGSAGSLPIGQNLVGVEIDAKYKLQAVLGEGGMSTVYSATTREGEPVAVKIMSQSLLSNPIALSRFKREMSTSDALHHQHIVRTIDSGTINDIAYLVMERLTGHPLSEVIAEQTMETARAVDLLLQVAQALEYAHSQSIVHRDIKPSNIMVLLDEQGRETIKLVDFGISKLLPEADSDLTKLTQTGHIFGSPLYMSPEQCQGAKVDRRTDIYSFGCILYELLAGKPPFRGPDHMTTIFQHVHGELTLPELPTDLDTESKSQLYSLITALLEKVPEARCQSFTEVIERLQILRERLVSTRR